MRRIDFRRWPIVMVLAPKRFLSVHLMSMMPLITCRVKTQMRGGATLFDLIRWLCQLEAPSAI